LRGPARDGAELRLDLKVRGGWPGLLL